MTERTTKPGPKRPSGGKGRPRRYEKSGLEFHEGIGRKGGNQVRETAATYVAGEISPPAGGTVPRAEFEVLLRRVEALTERVEDIEDALDAQAARADAKPGDALPAVLVERMIAGESPVRIWREHRGLTLVALAEKAAVPQGYLSEIENRKKPGSAKALKALAAALDVDLDDLVP